MMRGLVPRPILFELTGWLSRKIYLPATSRTRSLVFIFVKMYCFFERKNVPCCEFKTPSEPAVKFSLLKQHTYWEWNCTHKVDTEVTQIYATSIVFRAAAPPLNGVRVSVYRLDVYYMCQP